jgi:Hemerythrin HHE cation binding domain
MPDVTQLILDEHAWFREQFAALDLQRARSPLDVEAVERLWTPLAERLDVHALAEEQVFYPELLRVGKDPEDETLDAIGDHNEIRDGVHDAARHPVGTPQWWDAVGRARAANDEHMGEEEREGLANFRIHAAPQLREELGDRFAAFLAEHPTTAGLDVSDKDPEEYVTTIERDLHEGVPGDVSLGIGSLKEH